MFTRCLFLAILVIAWEGEKLLKTDSAWREELGRERYNVMRRKGTERAFLGEYVFTEKEGTYVCAACKLPLFSSKNKYNAGSGWPSFTQPIFAKNVYYMEDWSMEFKRYEVLCSRCDSHLGHIFNEGDENVSQKKYRYCINSIALILKF